MLIDSICWIAVVDTDKYKVTVSRFSSLYSPMDISSVTIEFVIIPAATVLTYSVARGWQRKPSANTTMLKADRV